MSGYRLIDEAQHELLSGVSFYSAQYPGLGRDFALEIRRLCRLIAEAPYVANEISPEIRRRFVRRFPYSVIYTLEGSEVVVLALAHQSRKPGYWALRG